MQQPMLLGRIRSSIPNGSSQMAAKAEARQYLEKVLALNPSWLTPVCNWASLYRTRAIWIAPSLLGAEQWSARRSRLSTLPARVTIFYRRN